MRKGDRLIIDGQPGIVWMDPGSNAITTRPIVFLTTAGLRAFETVHVRDREAT